MDADELKAWFRTYVETFAACARGEHPDATPMLEYYGIPLLLTSGAGLTVRGTAAEVVDPLGPQLEALRADGYARSEILQAEVDVLNPATALYRGEFSRHRTDGSEISRFWVTYLIAEGPEGRRIRAMAAHSG